MNIRLTLTLWAVTASICVTAQTGILRGRISDTDTKEPLVGAYVLYGNNKGTSANFDGDYQLELEYGTYDLRITYVGYQEISKRVTIDRPLVQQNFRLETIMMNEVEVVADVARARETPVAFTNVLPAQIQEELGSQDIPMILNSTPGVYATQQGGGDGDARITIRGFDQRNVAVMIDGIPVNDMENGFVYWSNWFGLDAVTRTIQVQRGLGASKIAIPSVGGTMNIITKGIDARKGVSIKQEVANDNFFRTTVGLTSGRMKNGWGITVAGSFKQGDGWVDQTFTQGWFYYLKVEKQLGKHILSLSAMGAPQEHGQRSFSRPIASWDHQTAYELGIPYANSNVYPEYGLRHNIHWGSYEERIYSSPDEYTVAGRKTVNERINFYHKPMFALRDFWSVNEKLYISNIAYLSIGRGAGTGLVDSQEDAILTPDGQIDFQRIYDNNVLFEFGPNGLDLDEDGEARSDNYIRASYNNHFWYGALSSATYKYDDRWTFAGGLDYRSYEGEHYREPYNLIGGDYVYDSDNVNIAPETKLRVGDKIDYYDIGFVKWGGAFLQAEYSEGVWSAFANISGALSWYKGRDYFRPRVLALPDTTLEIAYATQVEHNGTTYNRNSPGLEVYETDWVRLGGFTIKGGANYNMTEFMNIFANIGLLSRATRFDNVISRDNDILEGYENELIEGYELGWSYARQKVAINLNAYYTKWNNRPVNRTVRVPNPLEAGEDASVFIPDMDALHMGIEMDGAYVINSYFTLEAIASIADWTWQSEEEGQIEDNSGNLLVDPNTGEAFTLAFDPRGVHVGDAAQLQFGAGLRYESEKDFYIQSRWTYFDKFYANFNPEDLVGPNAGKDSWRVPGYSIIDLHAGQRFKMMGVNFSARASIFNLLNTKYIADARNNDPFSAVPLQNFDAASASVFFGLGRRFNISLTANF